MAALVPEGVLKQAPTAPAGAGSGHAPAGAVGACFSTPKSTSAAMSSPYDQIHSLIYIAVPTLPGRLKLAYNFLRMNL